MIFAKAYCSRNKVAMILLIQRKVSKVQLFYKNVLLVLDVLYSQEMYPLCDSARQRNKAKHSKIMMELCNFLIL